MVKKHRKKISIYIPYVVLWIGFLIGSFRLFTYITTKLPLGYDPGIYLFLFEDYGQLLRNFDFSLLASWNQHEPLLWILAALFGKIWISGEWLVRRWLWIASMLPWVILAKIFWKKNKRLAIITAFLYRISITQYEAFFRAYFKQIIGISLMLLCVHSLHKKKSLALGIWLLLLILLHRHSALYIIPIVLIYLTLQSIREKKIPYKMISVITIRGIFGALVYIHQADKFLIEAWEVLTTTFGGKGMGGIFMERKERILLTISLLLLSSLGIYDKVRNKEYDGWLIWYGLGLLWIGLQLVNYKRTLIFVDIFVLIIAARGLMVIFQKFKKHGRAVLAIFLVIKATYYLNYVSQHNTPLISESEFQAIHSLKITTPKNAIIMLTHKNYTPRVMWYSGRDRISPWYSDLDVRTREQRQVRRSSNGTVKCQMLKNHYSWLPRPIYIRLGNKQHHENLDGASCLKEFIWADNFHIFEVKY